MDIPLIVVLIGAEILLVLIGLCITFAFLLMRKPKQPINNEAQSLDDAEAELDAFDLGSSYIDFLDQAMQRNTIKISQQINIEEDEAREESTREESTEEESTGEEPTKDAPDEADENIAPAPNEKQSELLQAREQFLLIEKAAAESSEHEIKFWDSLYEGLHKIIDKYKSIETINETETIESVETKSKENVFYIETQGKKINGEVNKLKDIISEQENTLSSMQKAISDAEEEFPDDSPILAALREQISIIERQLGDSKMCMEVLEMENNRLQEEVDQMDNRHEALFSEDEPEPEKESVIDLDQMKEVVAQQESKIQQLIDTIESLEIEASQADRLKDTLKDFTRTSQEMMSCISILEEENERLQDAAHHEEPADDDGETSSEEVDAIKSKISTLEEELIKKDVVYAQLQDEFTSMETEYLAMYEAMHGDNS